jgi:YD repeat-containing protein
MEYKYNGLGEVREIKDQLGSIRTLDYDKLGRLEHDRVTALGTGVDWTIMRITRSYDNRGLLQKLSSYDNLNPGSGTVINEVQYAYDGFGLLITEYQSAQPAGQPQHHAEGAVCLHRWEQ